MVDSALLFTYLQPAHHHFSGIKKFFYFLIKKIETKLFLDIGERENKIQITVAISNNFVQHYITNQEIYIVINQFTYTFLLFLAALSLGVHEFWCNLLNKKDNFLSLISVTFLVGVPWVRISFQWSICYICAYTSCKL
jgi:hypothetical protein